MNDNTLNKHGDKTISNTNRFDGKGEIYAKARPKYALEFFDYLKNELVFNSSSVFADIGSGTGIFTEQLLNCGYKVFAVEPNDDMRNKAEEKLSLNHNFKSVLGRDSDFNLPDNSVDCVTAAQAFHWFDTDAFAKECKRVLKDGGKVILIYNSRDEDSGCTKKLAEVRHRYNNEFKGFSNGISEEKCVLFFSGECSVFSADNTQVYDRQGYVNRVLSSSYSLNEDDERYQQYLCDINEIFDEFSENGFIRVPVHTVAYIGEM